MEIKHKITGAVLLTIEEADLREADLRGANLRGANLQEANLQEANLYGANLQEANLYGANLQEANLQEADLQGANLQEADLQGANLYGADLYGADLRGADLYGADLRGADLRGADLPRFHLCPDGQLTVYKKAFGKVVELRLSPETKRTSSLVGRKCRAASAEVIAIWNLDRTPSGLTSVNGDYNQSTVYEVGKTVKPDKYDDDIRVECTHGIHFFITFKEAVEY